MPDGLGLPTQSPDGEGDTRSLDLPEAYRPADVVPPTVDRVGAGPTGEDLAGAGTPAGGMGEGTTPADPRDRIPSGVVVPAAKSAGAAARGPIPGSGISPPFANRGVETTEDSQTTAKNRTDVTVGDHTFPLIRRGWDYLTVSTTIPNARLIRDRSMLVDEGNAVRGFARTERRGFWGGQFWRRWEPAAPMKLLGLQYENFEFDGAQAHAAIEDLVPQEGSSPSRIDCAVDLAVPEDYTARSFVEAGEAVSDARGFSITVKGSWRGAKTFMLGNPDSGRAVRVYRRDLHPKNAGFVTSPELRLELVLSSDHSRPLWRIPYGVAWYAVCSQHIADITGVVVGPLADVPPPELKPQSDAVARLSTLFAQHGAIVTAALDAGVDLNDAAEAWKFSVASRATSKRHRDNLKEFIEYGPDEVGQEVAKTLANRSSRDQC